MNFQNIQIIRLKLLALNLVTFSRFQMGRKRKQLDAVSVRALQLKCPENVPFLQQTATGNEK